MWSPGQGATDAARSPSIITTRFPQTYGLRATASASERGCMRSLRPAVSGARTPLSYSGDCDGYEDRGMTQRSGRVDHSMTTQTIPRTDIRRALLWGGLLAILWVAVAIIRSGTTFHLAPFLVAAAPPVLFTMDDGFTADLRSVTVVGAISAALALGTALFVSAVGAMEGPAFEPFPTSTAEALVFAAVGAAVGIGFGWLRSR